MAEGRFLAISPTAIIKGNVTFGDNVYIGDSVQILCDCHIGDYSKIHNHVTIHSQEKEVRIGHNAWIGQGSIIDGIGGTTIGNNCGIGAYSQLWSHIRYGDPLIGCNYNSHKPLVIGNDVWFVGHCIVSPITAEDCSMALVGSVVTKDMKYNKVYGGTPAKELMLLPQFTGISIDKKMWLLKKYKIPKNCKLIVDDTEIKDGISCFNIMSRKYTKLRTKEEIELMLQFQKDLIKFVPYEA